MLRHTSRHPKDYCFLDQISLPWLRCQHFLPSSGVQIHLPNPYQMNTSQLLLRNVWLLAQWKFFVFIQRDSALTLRIKSWLQACLPLDFVLSVGSHSLVLGIITKPGHSYPWTNVHRTILKVKIDLFLCIDSCFVSNLIYHYANQDIIKEIINILKIHIWFVFIFPETSTDSYIEDANSKWKGQRGNESQERGETTHWSHWWIAWRISLCRFS